MVLCKIWLIIGYLSGMAISKNTSDVCLTTECSRSAERILVAMDNTVDPCDDFYQFTCGNFVGKTVIPDEEPEVDQYVSAKIDIDTQVYNLLKKQKEDEKFPYSLMKRFFTSCMDTRQVHKDGIKPLLAYLNDWGSWPALEGHSWDKLKWKEIYLSLPSVVLSVDTLPDPQNKSSKIYRFSEPELILNREILIKGVHDELVRAYYDLMVNLTILLGADSSTATVDMLRVMQFQIKLAKIMYSRERHLGDHKQFFNIMTLRELNKKFTYINWTEMVIVDGLSPTATGSEKFIVTVPEYFASLGNLLKKTSKRTLANSILWISNRGHIELLDLETRLHLHYFNKLLVGIPKSQPRWLVCVRATQFKFSVAVAALHIKNFFKKDIKTKAMGLVTEIKNAYAEMLKQAIWIDPKTRELALLKINKMKSYVAYPDDLLKDEEIVKFYKPYRNVSTKISSTLFDMFYDLEHFNDDWQSFGLWNRAVAMYSHPTNSFEIPVGNLLSDFIEPDRPQYLNYGALGVIIGHEMGHGFDVRGRQYDENGTLSDWWQPSSVAQFEEKTKCFAEQFGNLTERQSGIRVNGILTLNENISDNLGISAAYLAYRKWLKKNGADSRLQNLEQFNSKQMFWITFGRISCTKQRPEYAKFSVFIDHHSPSAMRVTDTLKNIKQFADDFKCPIGSPMNPSKKCKLW